MIEEKKYRRNPSPEHDGQNALAVVQDLCWASIIPLISVYLKQGPFSIYYLKASRGGLRLGALLNFIKITVSAPLKINDLYYIDTPHANHWKIQHEAVKACREQLGSIETLVNKYLPDCTPYLKKLLATNVSQAWQVWLVETLLLRSAAQQLGLQEGFSTDRMFVISRYVSLIKILNLDSQNSNDISMQPQSNQNRFFVYILKSVASSIQDVVLVFFRSVLLKKKTSSFSADPFKIGAAAAWGTDGMDKTGKDDLFWWRNSALEPHRLLYMFERGDIQPTFKEVKKVQDLGIQSVALNSKFPGDSPNLLVENNESQSFLESLRMLAFSLKLCWKALFGNEFYRFVKALVAWQYISGKKLSGIYKTLNLKGVFHFEEAGMDIISLASAFNDSIRFGTNWSCHHGMNLTSCRNHQVYFFWGNHDAQQALDAGSMAQSMLISGSFLSDHPDRKTNSMAQEKVEEMRKRGVRYILALLDNSPPCPQYYQFFLQWLVEDPCLGLLIKSKGHSWNKLRDDGLDGLIECAYKTNRIHDLDSKSSPTDASRLSDFTIGVASMSALAASALEGSRVLFLDYERVDQGPQKPYCILHSLGLNRCVFYEPRLLRQSVMDYFKNPTANPYLGDVTPILDQLDPFRDGKASQRIGEFVSYYLEEIDKGLNIDDAIHNATDKYGEKWGEDKVVRRI
jgi:hypothetical protein